MGEIADMHVRAYEAGLDPNEMDGADWVEFFENEDGEELEELSVEEAAEAFAIDMLLALEGSLPPAEDGALIAATMRQMYPQLTEGQADGFVAVLAVILRSLKRD